VPIVATVPFVLNTYGVTVYVYDTSGCTFVSTYAHVFPFTNIKLALDKINGFVAPVWENAGFRVTDSPENVPETSICTAFK